MRSVNRFYVIVGPSGSGKTTLAKRFSQCTGFRVARSVTTRPKRFSDEDGYEFVTRERFEEMRPGLTAVTEFNGNFYGLSESEVYKSDIFVCDPVGALTLRATEDREAVIILLKLSKETLQKRLVNRGDKDRLDEELSQFSPELLHPDVVLNAEKPENEVLMNMLWGISRI